MCNFAALVFTFNRFYVLREANVPRPNVVSAISSDGGDRGICTAVLIGIAPVLKLGLIGATFAPDARY